MNVEVETKSIVTVAEMAHMVGVSRARFYQLIGTAFPHPVYDVLTRRPLYNEEMQRACLEVRKRNCGMDGKPILFYARRLNAAPKLPKPRKLRANKPTNDPLFNSLKALGLVAVTQAEVQSAIKTLYPGGVNGTDQGEVIRAVFLKLKRRNTADNVGR